MTSARPAVTAPRDIDALVRLAAQGDVAAFSDFYDAMAARVEGLVHRIVGDARRSEEVAYEVWLDIWRTAPTFEMSRVSATTWALTLAHRRAVNEVRSDSARWGGTVGPVLVNTGPESAEGRRVPAVVSELSASELETIELAYFGSHTLTDIADVTRVPIATVAARLREGLLTLSAVLAATTPESA